MPVVVAGAGVSGAAAARALRERGARVTVVDRSEQRAEPLRAEGFEVCSTDDLPAGTALVVTSPGWRPDAPLLVAASAAGVEVIGEVELAWRLQASERESGGPAWLAVTGTNGKTTTVRMLSAILSAAGLRTVAAGNIGVPLLEAVLAPEPYAVLAVELSSFQLHWSSTVRPHTAVVLNVAPDHLDWHGSPGAYAAAKGRIHGPGTVAVYNRQ
ncbi:MAG: Mur ligase family protein, partial [Actinomycetota bacterium]|nr:Mur ligase family protein [Actinomycetota bacterium]